MYIKLYIYHFISTYRSYSWNCQCIGIWDDMDKKLLHTAVFLGNEHKFIIMYPLFGVEQEGIGFLTVTCLIWGYRKPFWSKNHPIWTILVSRIQSFWVTLILRGPPTSDYYVPNRLINGHVRSKRGILHTVWTVIGDMMYSKHGEMISNRNENWTKNYLGRSWLHFVLPYRTMTKEGFNMVQPLLVA
jgi:hypothetical protein